MEWGVGRISHYKDGFAGERYATIVYSLKVYYFLHIKRFAMM